MAKAAIGRLTKNTHRQLSTSVRKPPIIGPTALPKPATPRMSPPARPALSAGRSPVRHPEDRGPHQGTTDAHQHAAQDEQVGLRREASEEEKTAKMTAPITKMRLRPSRSASRPPVTIKTPNTSA